MLIVHFSVCIKNLSLCCFSSPYIEKVEDETEIEKSIKEIKNKTHPHTALTMFRKQCKENENNSERTESQNNREFIAVQPRGNKKSRKKKRKNFYSFGRNKCQRVEEKYRFVGIIIIYGTESTRPDPEHSVGKMKRKNIE